MFVPMFYIENIYKFIFYSKRELYINFLCKIYLLNTIITVDHVSSNAIENKNLKLSITIESNNNSLRYVNKGT